MDQDNLAGKIHHLFDIISLSIINKNYLLKSLLSVLYLPITNKSIDRIISAKCANQIESIIGTFRVPEIAALLLLQKIPDIEKMGYSFRTFQSRLERYLFDFIKISKDIPRSDVETSAIRNLKKDKIIEGYALLEKNKIALSTDDEVAQQKYIDITGNWVWGDKVKKTKDFFVNTALKKYTFDKYCTRDQNRILNIFMADQDESLDIVGYAGTGKTKLISYLVDIINTDEILVLAMTKQQLVSMTTRLNRKVRAKTFGQLAIEILESDLSKPERRVGNRSNRKYTISFAELANKMGYYPLGSLNPMWVAASVAKTVNRFCYSNDLEILPQHVPDFNITVDENDKLIIHHLAKELWETIISPSKKGIELPIKEYHRIKHLEILGAPIPNHYTHIIIDESHDLPKPVIKILDRSSQIILTFGDRYQALDRRFISNRRSHHIRQKQMMYSVRAGDNISDLYNNIIAQHPFKPLELFEGSKEKTTTIHYYDKFEIPKHYCAILSNNSWFVFHNLLRLSKSGSKFFILNRGYEDLRWLIVDAIDFYRNNIKPSHPDFSQYNTWPDFVLKHQGTIIEKINKIFQKGYNSLDLDNTLDKQEKYFLPDNAYVLGRIEDAKNMEFRSVMLMQDSLILNNDSIYEKANLINHIYTGISRAQKELIIPAYLEDWIKENLQTKPEEKTQIVIPEIGS